MKCPDLSDKGRERGLSPDPVDQGSADDFDDLLYDLLLISIGVLSKESTSESGALRNGSVHGDR